MEEYNITEVTESWIDTKKQFLAEFAIPRYNLFRRRVAPVRKI